MSDTKRVSAATGTTHVEAGAVLDMMSGDVKAAISAIDLAQFYERDPAWAAKTIRDALRK